jgi:hypothetical protein
MASDMEMAVAVAVAVAVATMLRDGTARRDALRGSGGALARTR